ncbi:quinone oxidoreductase family protein [Pollutimonas harenae]|uniref:Quinone oxidoreductase n=1 Tax=Pollutimonas harenae TaxID=657015 RepID=A0A853H086_9BURK|nr:quinone oxidoreductase [Pollutimonas harenae]NYT84695.1 quinone oxidoreductase [Pollutimonas harenae]TEA72902.1 quinone oxidoreductase [Pollutimonas harenae]
MSTVFGKCIVNEPGGPSAIEWVQETLSAPADDEVSLQQEAISVDFIDIQIRKGSMGLPLPTGLGFSAVGKVVAKGKQVTGLEVGDRVAYSHSVAGAYAEYRNIPADRAFRLPDQSLAPEVAAGALFRGLTAWYLATRMKPIAMGDTVLVHAAAGGVGLILAQWLKHLGATVIGVVRGADKQRLALQNGCAHAIDSSSEDFVERVKVLTDGRGVSIVFDSVGKDTFEASLDCLARFGLMVSYGWASGDIEPVSLPALRNRGSLFITRPTISHYTAEASDFQEGAAALFELMASGAIQLTVGQTFALRDAGKAHEALASRGTVGSTVLVP